MSSGNFKSWLALPAVVLLSLILSSCGDALRQLTYIHDVKVDSVYPRTALPDPYRIRPNDQLYISVVGEDKENIDFFNVSTTNIGGNFSADLLTYLVNEKGNITYPMVGDVYVEGLTLLEIRDKIQLEVDKFVMKTSVMVRLANRTFTVLGDVNNGGLIMMPKNQYTIFEALGAAGGVSDYGNRKNIKLLRETPRGTKVVSIDLTDDDLLTSEYYYILPNDVIVVEPGKFRVYETRIVPWLNQATFAASLLSTAFLVLNLILK